MTVAFRAVASTGVTSGSGTSYTSGTVTISVPMPAGTSDGDLMLALIVIGSNTSVTCAPPSGWTLITSAARSTAGRVFLYQRIASSEAGPYVFTGGGVDTATTRTHDGQILSFSGVHPTTPVNASVLVSKSNTPPLQSQPLTTTVDNALLLHMIAVGATPQSANDIWTGATRVSDEGTTNIVASTATEAAPTAGAYVARSVVMANANTGTTTYNYVSGTVAIAPPPAAPLNTATPVASGAFAVGSTLTTTNGTWSGSPTSYAYQWKRDGVVIASETASTYTVVSADVGHTLTCTVTATNANGSTSADSTGVAIFLNTFAPVRHHRLAR